MDEEPAKNEDNQQNLADIDDPFMDIQLNNQNEAENQAEGEGKSEGEKMEVEGEGEDEEKEENPAEDDGDKEEVHSFKINLGSEEGRK